jgi:DNA sulfur modification protein DndD
VIFESLSLHNFGAYFGEHTLQLSTSATKPVVLIGALNGSGKTTLLEAVQLALFGKAVRGTSRSKMAYGDYLLQAINRNADPASGASVSLDFRQRQGGQDDVFSVTRTWKKVGDAARESLTVTRNGVQDAEASDRWLEFVEEFLPVQIADLFLFDGERIESLADPERSSEMLRTGVHALLGLDLVDHLSRSLLTLERRKRTQDSSTTRLERALEELERQREQVLERRQSLVESRARTQTEVDQLTKQLQSTRQLLNKEGGALFSSRTEAEHTLLSCRGELQQKAAMLRELAMGEAPLLLVEELLDDARDLVEENRSAAVARTVSQVLQRRDTELLSLLKKARISSPQQHEIKGFLEHSRQKWQSTQRPHAGFSATARIELGGDQLEDLRQRVRTTLTSFSSVQEGLARAQARISAIPSEDALKVHLDAEREIEQKIQHHLAKLAVIDEELNTVRTQLDRMGAQLEARRLEVSAARLDDQDAARIVTHSERARNTLRTFREAVAAKNVARLERLVGERFKVLVRKGDALVSGVAIDPKTFELRLLDKYERVLDPMLLSAGERQLLAVATVWALARASGRTLPTIIDTPLGRLDSEHRTRLVDNYFPAASHQVVLLSTDEEINGRYYSRLKPKVAREYVVHYDAALGSSRIERGYFAQVGSA